MRKLTKRKLFIFSVNLKKCSVLCVSYLSKLYIFMFSSEGFFLMKIVRKVGKSMPCSCLCGRNRRSRSANMGYTVQRISLSTDSAPFRKNQCAGHWHRWYHKDQPGRQHYVYIQCTSSSKLINFTFCCNIKVINASVVLY